MKDPWEKTQRPYEVLGVAPEVSVKEAERVYAAALRDRKNNLRRQAISAAFDRLRRLERRLEDEIFYYQVGDVLAVDLATGFAALCAPDRAARPLHRRAGPGRRMADRGDGL